MAGVVSGLPHVHDADVCVHRVRRDPGGVDEFIGMRIGDGHNGHNRKR